jgi:hypothetical protein
MSLTVAIVHLIHTYFVYQELRLSGMDSVRVNAMSMDDYPWGQQPGSDNLSLAGLKLEDCGIQGALHLENHKCM